MLCPARGALPEWQNARTFYVCPRRCTRMMGMQNLPLPYTVLEASLPVSKCSPILCQPHPNGGTAEPASSERAAAPEWRDSGTCHCRTRCWKPACQKSHALPFLRNTHPNGGTAEPAIAAHGAGSQLVRNHMLSRFCGTRTRMAGRQNLLVPLTLLKIILSISACLHIFCLSSLLSIHTVCVRRTDGRFAREQMLFHSLPAAQNPFPHYPIYYP